MTKRRAGFTLFELAVVICIVSIVATILVGRVERLQAAAERAQMESVLGALRSGLTLQAAQAVAQGRQAELIALIGTNPMESLLEPPPNYLGEVELAATTEVPGGSWYFDRTLGLLVYRVRHESYFASDLAGPARARFKFQLMESEPAHGLRMDPHGVRGITLAAVEPYRWVAGGAR